MRQTLLVISALIFVLGACASAEEAGQNTPSGASPTSAPTSVPTATAPPANPLGTLSLEENQVLHGQDEKALSPLLESASFFEHDFIQVIEGGEAVLDFGDMMRLRLFNDTQLEMVSAEIVETIPLGVQVYLFVGGFTGQLTREGGRAVFRTPGDVEITVLGTEYYVVYDPDTETTFAGNFGGTVEVSSAGSQASLDDGFFVMVPAGSPPGPQLPLPVSREEFEVQAREASSPVQAARQAAEWSLEIRHEFSSQPEEGPATSYLRLWSGQFALEGDTIVGSGKGVVNDVNLRCLNSTDPANVIRAVFNLEGSFDFDIRGKLVTGEGGRPAFMIEITTSNLATNSLSDISSIGGNCDFFTEFFINNNRIIVEDLPLLDAEAIIVEASKGAKAVYDLNGEPYTYNVGEFVYTYAGSIYFRNPIEVTVLPGQ